MNLKVFFLEVLLNFLPIFNLSMSDNRQIFSLKQVAASIRKVIEDRYAQLYWIRAEMHKLNRYPSGHCFPELVQKEDDKIVAQMNASIWKHNYERINQNFIRVVKEPLQEGTTLLMQVKITFHETFGLSLQIMDIDPNYSLGELQRERQETLLKLQKEGLLNLNQKLNYPLLPKRIAIISADTSKGLSDFRNVMANNANGYQFFMHLFPAYLQGDVAIPSIIEQLKKIEKVKHHFDVVVIVRGGGGEVGLSCYNNYELCKSIAQFPLPILTGIGHSTNLTVAEMVAFRNAITPTELADFLIGSFQEIDLYLRESQRSIISVTKNIIERSKSGLTSEVKLFKNVTQKRLMETKNTLVSSSSSMKSGVKLRMQKEQEFISNSHISIKRSVKELVSQQNTGLKTYNERISKGANYLFKEQRNDLNSIADKLPKLTQFFVQKNTTILTQLEQTIRLIDPINVLKRGYSIALIEGKIISENNPVEPGKTMVVKTHQFEIETEIKKIKEL